MQRIPRHRLLAALLTFLSLIVVAILPIGVASAASPSTTCPSDPFCILVISAPESVVAGQVFTVQVAVTTDGFTVAKSDPCASKVLVTLDVDGPSTTTEGPPVFPFLSTQSVNAKAGIATFSVSVASPGSYQLVASAGVGGDAPTTSNCSNYFYQSDTANFMAVDVAAGQPIAPCPDNVTCTQLTSGSGSAATLFADTTDTTASFAATFSSLTGPGCANLSPVDPGGVLTFTLITTTPASKTVIFALRSDLITNGIGRYNICWKSPIPFTPLGGGTPVTTGLLPDCKNSDVGPCVLFRTSGQHNVGFFGILAPPGDPQAYPGV